MDWAATMEDQLSTEEVECVLGFLEAPKDLGTAAAVCHRWAVRSSRCCARRVSLYLSRTHTSSLSLLETLSFSLSLSLTCALVAGHLP